MLLGHPELGIDIKKEPDALSDQMVEDLQQEWVWFATSLWHLYVLHL